MLRMSLRSHESRSVFLVSYIRFMYLWRPPVTQTNSPIVLQSLLSSNEHQPPSGTCFLVPSILGEKEPRAAEVFGRNQHPPSSHTHTCVRNKSKNQTGPWTLSQTSLMSVCFSPMCDWLSIWGAYTECVSQGKHTHTHSSVRTSTPPPPTPSFPRYLVWVGSLRRTPSAVLFLDLHEAKCERLFDVLETDERTVPEVKGRWCSWPCPSPSPSPPPSSSSAAGGKGRWGGGFKGPDTDSFTHKL